MKALVVTLIETIRGLEERGSHLDEQLNQNSQNPSRPPQKMGLERLRFFRKGKGGRKRGAQPGHPGHSRKLYPPDTCQSPDDGLKALSLSAC